MQLRGVLLLCVLAAIRPLRKNAALCATLPPNSATQPPLLQPLPQVLGNVLKSAATTTVSGTDALTAKNNVIECLNELQVLKELPALRRLQHFGAWTQEEEEEVPCFTRCILHAQGLFDIPSNKWHKQRIVDELSADVYNYCRYELDREYGNACEFVHRGFRCMQQAEKNMQGTLMHLKSCVAELGGTMDQLADYGKSDEREAMPCLFKCFAERMDLYAPTGEWNFTNWVSAFGPVKYAERSAEDCRVSAERRLAAGADKCEWMYEEYICVEHLQYNTDGSQSEMPLIGSTTTEATGSTTSRLITTTTTAAASVITTTAATVADEAAAETATVTSALDESATTNISASSSTAATTPPPTTASSVSSTPAIPASSLASPAETAATSTSAEAASAEIESAESGKAVVS